MTIVVRQQRTTLSGAGQCWALAWRKAANQKHHTEQPDDRQTGPFHSNTCRPRFTATRSQIR
jgi:hypothetical protein